MYQTLQVMWESLNQKKKKLQDQKSLSIKLIYKNLLEDKPLNAILIQLQEVSVSRNLYSYFEIITKLAYKRLTTLNNQIKNNIFVNLTPTMEIQKKTPIRELKSLLLTNMFTKGQWEYNSQKIINRELRQTESRLKNYILLFYFGSPAQSNEIKKSIEIPIQDFKSEDKVFWVASQHKDCAKDHKDYQGKIYYNANYDKRDKRITEYIKKHSLMSVQEVTSDPVWFITRPHCRHYFVHYSYDAIASGKYRIPTRKTGLRRLKTQKIDGVGEERARATIEYYTNRLNNLLAFNKVQSNARIRADIQKCRDLIRKWKKEL